MARSSRKLAINYSPESLVDLDEIWEWNAKPRGAVYADSYVAALKSATFRLTQLSNGPLKKGSDPLRATIFQLTSEALQWVRPLFQRAANPGMVVPTSSIYRCAVLKHRRKGHGHVVAFTVEHQNLYVWRYFHTSQDWQNRTSLPTILVRKNPSRNFVDRLSQGIAASLQASQSPRFQQAVREGISL